MEASPKGNSFFQVTDDKTPSAKHMRTLAIQNGAIEQVSMTAERVRAGDLVYREVLFDLIESAAEQGKRTLAVFKSEVGAKTSDYTAVLAALRARGYTAMMTEEPIFSMGKPFIVVEW